MKKAISRHIPSPIIKLFIFPALSLLILSSCNDGDHAVVSAPEIVESPEQINARAEAVIQGTLVDILKNNKDLPDSFRIRNAPVLQYLYDQHSFQPIWCSKGQFTSQADSLFVFLANARYYGLFPENYYYTKLTNLRTQLVTDTAVKKKLDASLWAYGDMLLTSAFVQAVKDLKVGRLLPDSVVSKDSTLTGDYFFTQLKLFREEGRDSFARQLEPLAADYQRLKDALHTFLQTADFRSYTYVSAADSSLLPSLVFKRLAEEDSTLAYAGTPDSLQLSAAIRRYQEKREMKADGKLSTAVIKKLNETDTEKFIRIAINMDRYKQLPVMPEQYIWVNLPGYYLQLREKDSVALQSKVVVGKPATRTPVITSAISDMITYPKWHIPESIIKKEILPGLKKDAGYTIRKGYMLVDKDGNEIDPYSVDWKKFKDYIPYRVIQGSGDDNALGVLKFNFPNKYSVYLHDTNQRYLFSRSSRALSHGCVRVQSWNELAQYILRNDSAKAANAVPVDSLASWLAQKQKRYIPVRRQIPLYIRYFTCDTKEGDLVFYEDIYGEDRKLREKILSTK
ncbi:MAG TPA: L,D-transpeptidase family protein [Flavisolibacter sp.]|nr:L,D-transpeptidase family protein [Flavisolibacter sp.]